MKKENILILFLLAFMLFFGNKFREKDYATVPFPGEDADEYSFGWLGISLIKDHYPIAWSGIAGYKNHDFQKINVDKIFDVDTRRGPFPIDKPWFDHPPLMGLFVGGYAYLRGVRDFADASVIVLRRPMLKVAMLVSVLVFILGTQLFGKWVGVMSAFLYTIIPTMIISSRLAIAENGIIPLFLASLILAFQYFKKKKIYYWILASLVASVAVLFKLSGISVSLALIFLALNFGERLRLRLAIYPVSGAILSVLVFAGYGAYFDWTTFVNVLKANANRFFGASSEIFYSVISNSKITRNYTDGWVTASILAFIAVVFRGWSKDKNIRFLAIAAFSYLFVFLFFGSESYGFYRFPFYPFFIISLAYVLVELWKSPNVAVAAMLALLPLGTGIHRIVGVMDFQKFVPYFRAGVLASLVAFGAAFIPNKRLAVIVQRVFLVLVFTLMVYWAIREIYFVNVDKWYFVT